MARPAAAGSRELQQELIGKTLGGRYRIKGLLGEGGMGTVFDAEHLGLGRPVAIKVLSPSQAKKRVAVKRFQQEARAAGAIGHPNICEVYDLGLLDDGSPYLVMEKLVGNTLAERIAKEGGLPFDDVVEIIVQVLAGLAAAHEKGIIHRDIKPDNIFLARRPALPMVKLLDFGVSKIMTEFQGNEEPLDLTRTGMVMGTPYYMSPEQARGERNLDGRVDIYACGVVMYEALAGKRPFLAPNYNALLLAIINTAPTPLRDIRPTTPPELEAIIARAMARNRGDRFSSAREMLRALEPSAEAATVRRALRQGEPEHLAPPVVTDPSATRADSGAARAAKAIPRRREAPARVHPTLPSPVLQASRKPIVRRRTSEPPPPVLRGSIVETDDSIDIPVHFANTDDVPLDEDDATAVYQPEKPLRVPATPRRASREANTTKPIPTRRVAPENMALPPPAFPSPPDDEWDGETVVKHSSASPPFNPEQTVKISGNELEHLEQRRPPRRR